MPLAQYDLKNPNDVAKEPHEITHSIDALRYFVSGNPAPKIEKVKIKSGLPWALQENEDEMENEVMNW